MNNKVVQRKKKQPKPKPKPKQQQVVVKKASSPPKIPNASLHAICSMNDPFCHHAFGAKYMDNSRVRSLAFPFHYRVSGPTTNVNGGSTMLFMPGYTHQYAVGTITGGVSSYVNLTAVGNISNVMRYRIVSAGVVIRYTGAPLTASGIFQIRTFNSPDGSTLTSLDTGSYNCAEYADIPASSAREIVINFKKIDAMKAAEFNIPASTNPTLAVTDWKSSGWGPVAVALVGGPVSTPCFEVELFFHFELAFADNDGNSLLALPNPPSNSLVMAASGLVSNDTKAIMKEGIAAFGNMIARKAVLAASSYLGSRFPPARGLALMVD